MKIPAVIVADGVLGPDESIPENAIAVVCDGENYVVYEPGDEVPTPDGQRAVQKLTALQDRAGGTASVWVR
jgi:hypothetical protein